MKKQIVPIYEISELKGVAFNNAFQLWKMACSKTDDDKEEFLSQCTQNDKKFFKNGEVFTDSILDNEPDEHTDERIQPEKEFFENMEQFHPSLRPLATAIKDASSFVKENGKTPRFFVVLGETKEIDPESEEGKKGAVQGMVTCVAANGSKIDIVRGIKKATEDMNLPMHIHSVIDNPLFDLLDSMGFMEGMPGRKK